MEVTSSPRQENIQYISDSVRDHNFNFMPNDFCDLAIFERDSTGTVIAGLIATTYWERLDIRYLWISSEHRGDGLSKELLLSAEREAVCRGCKFSQVDTFNFQALGLYLKVGYSIFGELDGYENGHKRFYLHKKLEEI